MRDAWRTPTLLTTIEISLNSKKIRSIWKSLGSHLSVYQLLSPLTWFGRTSIYLSPKSMATKGLFCLYFSFSSLLSSFFSCILTNGWLPLRGNTPELNNVRSRRLWLILKSIWFMLRLTRNQLLLEMDMGTISAIANTIQSIQSTCQKTTSAMNTNINSLRSLSSKMVFPSSLQF